MLLLIKHTIVIGNVIINRMPRLSDSRNVGKTIKGMLGGGGAISFVIILSIYGLVNDFSMVNRNCSPITTSTIVNTTEESSDTTIIILSSLIPTHPSIHLINKTFNSLSPMLLGLPINTPKLISVDGLPSKKNTPENIHKLHEYVKQLRLRFQNDLHVSILNNYEHGHLSNSIRVALEMVKSEFIYVLQHDFSFIKPVNHTAIIASMRASPQDIQIVRFPYKSALVGSSPGCNVTNIRTHGIEYSLGKWSDNNHFTTKVYYEKVLLDVGSSGRFIEAPMMFKGTKIRNRKSDILESCSYAHQWVYNFRYGPFLEHLDGRHTQLATTVP